MHLAVAPPPLMTLTSPPPMMPLLPQTCSRRRTSSPLMQQPDGQPARSVQEQIAEMQERNQRRGGYVLGFVVAICVWLFTVPPDIRRTNICGLDGSGSAGCTELSALGSRVADHYATCGRTEGAPACVAFDFSVDPRSKASFDARVESLFGAATAE